jgi:AcrR family transcriptional regulator
MAAERDSTATRARLLEAATEEFAAHGIAGARVDRIAAAASANKQLIYAYFGSKDQLFDAVLTRRFRALTEDVPFAPDDLAGYVGRLFDYLVEHPEVLRLATWAGLERPTAVAAFEADSYRSKLIAIADAQRDGWLDASFAPADLLALALGVTGAWFTASEALRTHDSPNPWSPQRLTQFRAAAVEAATRILSGAPPPGDNPD